MTKPVKQKKITRKEQKRLDELNKLDAKGIYDSIGTWCAVSKAYAQMKSQR